MTYIIALHAPADESSRFDTVGKHSGNRTSTSVEGALTDPWEADSQDKLNYGLSGNRPLLRFENQLEVFSDAEDREVSGSRILPKGSRKRRFSVR